jgi:hypothetical protein
MVEQTQTLLGKRERPTETNEKPWFKENKNEQTGEMAGKPVCEYELKNGLRFVKPYNHEFVTFCKRRWIGKPLIEVYSAEFKAYSEKYYREAIADGRITINAKT